MDAVTVVETPGARRKAAGMPLAMRTDIRRRGEHRTDSDHSSGDAPAIVTRDMLLQRMAAAYPTLSPQLQRIARDVERYASTLAIDRLQDVATRCAVHPSAVIRFAGQLGFSGFRAHARARTSNSIGRRDHLEGKCRALHAERIEHTRAAWLAWQAEIDYDTLARAGRRLGEARSVRIACTSRGYVAACYCLLALLETGKPAELTTSMWSTPLLGDWDTTRDEAWLLVDLQGGSSFLRRVANKAVRTGTSLVVITDDATYPLGLGACDVLTVARAGGLDFDSAASTMTLCAAIMNALDHAKRSDASARATAV